MISSTYDDLWKFLIRPYRQTYLLDSLGNEIQIISEKLIYKRKDFNVKNSKNNELKCSIYLPYDSMNEILESDNNNKNKFAENICIFYLHSNSGSRIEAIPYLKELFNLKMIVCIFDFSGSGKSEGEYITMGYQESSDLKCVIDRINYNYGIKSFAFWGRSMGAITSLKFSSENIKYNIKCMILDSPYINLRQLIKDQIEKNVKLIPNLLVEAGLSILEKTINKKLNNVDIFQFDPEIEIKKCYIPTLFIRMKNDELIKANYVLNLYKNHLSAHKELAIFEGTHASSRDQTLITESINFIKKHCSLKTKKKIFDGVLLYKNDLNNKRNSIVPNNNKQEKNIYNEIRKCHKGDGFRVRMKSPEGYIPSKKCEEEKEILSFKQFKAQGNHQYNISKFVNKITLFKKNNLHNS